MGRYALAVALCLTLLACGGNQSVASPSLAAASVQPTAGSGEGTAKPTPAPTLVAAAPCTERTLVFDPTTLDLTGAWLGNDEGIYYIRQVGKKVWWNGMSGQSGPAALLGRDWTNVAAGEIKADLTIELEWADVPRGGVLGDGTLVWTVEDVDGNTRMRKLSETGSGFGGVIFTPCAPG